MDIKDAQSSHGSRNYYLSIIPSYLIEKPSHKSFSETFLKGFRVYPPLLDLEVEGGTSEAVLGARAGRLVGGTQQPPPQHQPFQQH